MILSGLSFKMFGNGSAMASRAGKETFRFRLVCEPELFVLYFSFLFQMPNPKDLADLVNMPKPLSIALYALFAIAIVGVSFC